MEPASGSSANSPAGASIGFRLRHSCWLAFWLPFKLLDGFRRPAVSAMEMVSFSARLLIAYLLFVGAWLLLAFLTSAGKPRLEPVQNGRFAVALHQSGHHVRRRPRRLAAHGRVGGLPQVGVQWKRARGPRPLRDRSRNPTSPSRNQTGSPGGACDSTTTCSNSCRKVCSERSRLRSTARRL